MGLVRIIKVFPELAGARIVWSKKEQEVRRGESASTVNLVHALAHRGGAPVILEASVAVGYERPRKSVESFTVEAMLEILRETGLSDRGAESATEGVHPHPPGHAIPVGASSLPCLRSARQNRPQRRGTLRTRYHEASGTASSES